MTSKVFLVIVAVLVFDNCKSLEARIITDKDLFTNGVPLNYSYNETSSNSNDIVSSEGCPKSNDGYPWVVYGDLEKTCYLVGHSASPCPPNSVMHKKVGSAFGVCACNYKKCVEESYFQHRNSSHPRYSFCYPRGSACLEFVFDREVQQCYVLYSQGPCGDEEWLELDGTSGGVKCGRRRCPPGMGFYEGSDSSERDSDEYPCCPPNFMVSGFTSVNENKCKKGEIFSETLKKCVTQFNSTSLVIG